MNHNSKQKEYVAPATTVVSLRIDALLQDTESDNSDYTTGSSFDSSSVLVASGISIKSGWTEEKDDTGSQMGKDNDGNDAYSEHLWDLEW